MGRGSGPERDRRKHASGRDSGPEDAPLFSDRIDPDRFAQHLLGIELAARGEAEVAGRRVVLNGRANRRDPFGRRTDPKDTYGGVRDARPTVLKVGAAGEGRPIAGQLAFDLQESLATTIDFPPGHEFNERARTTGIGNECQRGAVGAAGQPSTTLSIGVVEHELGRGWSPGGDIRSTVLLVYPEWGGQIGQAARLVPRQPCLDDLGSVKKSERLQGFPLDAGRRGARVPLDNEPTELREREKGRGSATVITHIGYFQLGLANETVSGQQTHAVLARTVRLGVRPEYAADILDAEASQLTEKKQDREVAILQADRSTLSG